MPLTTVMTRRMLLGIGARAERARPGRPAGTRPARVSS